MSLYEEVTDISTTSLPNTYALEEKEKEVIIEKIIANIKEVAKVKSCYRWEPDEDQIKFCDSIKEYFEQEGFYVYKYDPKLVWPYGQSLRSPYLLIDWIDGVKKKQKENK